MPINLLMINIICIFVCFCSCGKCMGFGMASVRFWRLWSEVGYGFSLMRIAYLTNTLSYINI